MSTYEEDKIQDASDELWLNELAKVWKSISGEPWDVMDGETREEAIATNLEEFARKIQERYETT